MILDQILSEKKLEVARRESEQPVAELEALAADATVALDFAAALHRNRVGLPAVIAEVKKASPSKGLIRLDFDPESIAKAYEAAGASAISVLTDEKFFQGALDYLAIVKKTVSLPVLRKDFIISEYQILEARAAGADAVLLIAAALHREQLARFMQRAGELGMQCLVEVHVEREMGIALDVGAKLIGINNRNLQTFEVSLETTARLLPMAQAQSKTETTFVSESGIFTRRDIESLGAIGVDAVLIGEALMRENDIESKLKELIA